jgi:hypothetical protein
VQTKPIAAAVVVELTILAIVVQHALPVLTSSELLRIEIDMLQVTWGSLVGGHQEWLRCDRVGRAYRRANRVDT